MIIPRTLEDWDYSVIRELVINDYYETDTFEFKPDLKPRHLDQRERDKFNLRIVESVDAFANTFGGFIVFGIEDMKKKLGEDRIVGVDRTDLAAEFGEKIKDIDPTVYYNFKNPAITIPHRNEVIFVVHIPRSVSRPHMVSTTGRFYYRTNKGNEIMSYHEVQREFLRYEERRNKLSLFYIEIISNLKIAERMAKLANTRIDSREDFLHFSTLKFEMDIMNNLLPEIFGIIQNDQSLIKSIFKLKLQVSPINTKIGIFHSTASNIQEMKFQQETHNDYIRQNVQNRTLPLLKEIKEHLELRHGQTNPISDSDFVGF